MLKFFSCRKQDKSNIWFVLRWIKFILLGQKTDKSVYQKSFDCEDVYFEKNFVIWCHKISEKSFIVEMDLILTSKRLTIPKTLGCSFMAKFIDLKILTT